MSEYSKMLEDHDWFYMFSDDPRRYQSGYNKGLYLRELADGNPVFAAKYKVKYHQMYQMEAK